MNKVARAAWVAEILKQLSSELRSGYEQTPPTLVALMERARDIPREKDNATAFTGIGIYLDGTIRIESYGSANRDPIYYPEEIEKQVLASL